MPSEALAGGSSSDDGAYASAQADIQSLTDRRESLAATIKGVLDGAQFGGVPLNERNARELIEQAEHLLRQARLLASDA